MIIIQTVLLSTALGVPNHPSDIVFPEYSFTPPSSVEYRRELSSGIPVYLAEDKELPLVNISFTFKGGSYLDPVDRVGLSTMMASLVRNGGTTSLSAEDLDERFDFLAAGAGVRGSKETITASLNSLSSNLDESLPLFIDMLRNPGFQQSRVDLSRDSIVENLKQRNDQPSAILRRETAALLYGNSYMGRQPTGEMVGSVTVDDLKSVHNQIINPSNMIISVSGDFDTDKMLQTLENYIGDWVFGNKVAAPPEINSAYIPGIYFVDQDVSQGGVRIGLRSLRQGDPDLEAATIMNYILGGGGFSSRITQTVRSNEGLAYSAGSFLVPGVYMDGLWGAGYESKSKTVALAADLIFNEINKIKTELVSEDDLNLAKSALIEQFPSIFQSQAQTIGVFVSDDISGRDPHYWSTYKNRITSVQVEDVLRVANDLLSEDKMAMLVVGNWGVISGGNDRATMEDVRKIIGGSVVELPLRDPLTLQPIE